MKKCARFLYLAVTMIMLATMSVLPATAEEQLEHMDVTISFFEIESSFSDTLDQTLLNTLEEKFNVTFQPMMIGWGDYTEKNMAWAASGTLPDLTTAVNVGTPTFYEWIDQGVVRMLPDDLSKYPHLQEVVALPDVSAFQVDGHSYFLPKLTYKAADTQYLNMGRGMLIRKDWLENLNLQMPTNAEELLEVLRAFTENDPDGNGVNDTVGMCFQDTNVEAYSQWMPCLGYTDEKWVKMNGEWVYACAEPHVIPLMDFFRTAYRNGWMDQDFITREINSGEVDFSAGKFGVLVRQTTPKHVNNIRNTWLSLNPDKDFTDCVAIIPFQGDDCYQIESTSYWAETYIPADVSDEKLERLLMIMDYLYSDEGVMLTTYGFEGVDYRIDENGEIVSLMGAKDDGSAITTVDKYSANFFNSMSAWNQDCMEYRDPNNNIDVREMCKAECERRTAEWKKIGLDFAVNALNLDAITEMTADFKAGWNSIIADTSDATTEELYNAVRKEWDMQNYQAAKEAVNAAAQEMGK